MTSISSLTGSTSSSFDGTISGLASGMDTDSIIEAMLSATQEKIDQALKDQTALEWEMEAYRELIDKLQDFSNTFITLSSSSSLYSESYFENSLVEVMGDFSDLVKVTGNVETDITIEKVIQLAKDSQIVSDKQMSDGSITTEDVTLGEKEVSLIEGETMTFTYGGVNYEVTLGAGSQYDADGDPIEGTVAQSKEDAFKALQDALESVSIDTSTTLADLVDVRLDDDGTVVFSRVYDADEEYEDVQDLQISAASDKLSEVFGFGVKTGNTTTDKDGTIIGQNLNYEYDDDNNVIGSVDLSAVEAMSDEGISEMQTFNERVDGNSLTFTYNGSKYSVVVDMSSVDDPDGNMTEDEKFMSALQTAIDRQIGSNRVLVSSEPGDEADTVQFTFTTVMTDKNDDGSVKTDANGNAIVVADTNSELSISGDSAFFGTTGEFGISSGTSNKVNIYQEISGSIKDSLEDMGFYDVPATGEPGSVELDRVIVEDKIQIQKYDDEGEPIEGEFEEIVTIYEEMQHNKDATFDFGTVTINGVDINVLGDITWQSVPQMMLNTETGEWTAKMDFDDEGNVFTAMTEGWVFSDGTLVSEEAINDRLAALTIDDIMQAINDSDANVKMSYNSGSDRFTMVSTVGGEGGTITMDDDFKKLFFGDAEIVQGQDAIIQVDYDGAGGSDSVIITRPSNSITVGDATITVTGTFDATETGGVTASGSINTEAIADSVEAMVNAYNDLISYINTQVTTKNDSDYGPLSDTEKAAMSESEIKLWEEKAKTGLLYGDSDLINLASELRSIFFETGEFAYTFAEIGITTSSDWTENGKLTFNRSTFESALEKDSATIQKMFTTTETSSGTNAGSTFGSSIGIMDKFKTILDKYVGTTGEYKGIFIEKAGHSSSPLSMLDNELQNAYDALDDVLESLKARLETQRERYTSQFTALEVYISQMNAQSSWLYDQL